MTKISTKTKLKTKLKTKETYLDNMHTINIKNTYTSPARLTNFGAVIPEKFICFSGGGAPTDARIITESPERTYNKTKY